MKTKIVLTILILNERFMPKLKYLFVNATTPDLRLLRGKTIECISLIGLAVGKDKVNVEFKRQFTTNFTQKLKFILLISF